ncbi:MAG: DUF2851 domain-containing protein [Pseudopedobacter saltans]|uniref:DUF2851 domain-containing protein n=1 Tax=Pseudopedobacter saltans TaxID=151895 RepID=A0A2W5F8Y0_9SPHI|nr:MAG: DUF2851 domain-containing protein [Pseudopedobacter saltans]
MNEKLLHFIWRYQYFQIANMETTNGELLAIAHPGLYNNHQGPDFLQGKIKIGKTILVGNIELHVKTSDWDAHQHSNDINYDNIILHVVWLHDKEIDSRHPFATLELQHYVPKVLLEKYNYLQNLSPKFIACQDSLPVLSELSWTNWKERLGVERLKRKTVAILESLVRYKGDWASVFWEEIAAGFGTKVNTECFRQMAASVPMSIIRRQRENLLVLEAILFGQLGLLDRAFEESYPKQLQKEYLYQKQKYALKKVSTPLAFLRMHPRNFPTIRLAQLAMLLHRSEHLFTKVISTDSLEELSSLFEVAAQSYWDNHFVLDKVSDQYSPKQIGNSMLSILLINCVVPMVFAYGKYHQDEGLQEKALNWLSQIGPEDNKIIKLWKQHGISSRNALESQSLLELYRHYCEPKKCLSCNVGIKYLNIGG